MSVSIFSVFHEVWYNFGITSQFSLSMVFIWSCFLLYLIKSYSIACAIWTYFLHVEYESNHYSRGPTSDVKHPRWPHRHMLSRIQQRVSWYVDAVCKITDFSSIIMLLWSSSNLLSFNMMFTVNDDILASSIQPWNRHVCAVVASYR